MSSDKVKVVVNGEEIEVPLSCTVENLIDLYGWKPTQVVVEHNTVVIARANVGKVCLKEGDRLEIIIPVAGG